MSGNGCVIEARGLSRCFGGVEAVRDLSFTVEAGSVFGLLGKNGSGKTTTIRLLLGLLRPDSGDSRILGEDSQRLSSSCRQRIGYLSEETFPHGDLPLPYLLRYLAALFPHWDWDYANDLVARFKPPLDRPLDVMSFGERRKCELLLVLAQKPDLLILDDPALGLDVTVRREFLWAALEVAREEGKAVLFTSHVLTDVERVVDTVGILEAGTLKLQAPLDDLKERTKRLVFTLPGVEAPEPEPLDGELSRSRKGREVVIVTAGCNPGQQARWREHGSLTAVEDLNLEDIFVAVVEGQTGVVPEVDA